MTRNKQQATSNKQQATKFRALLVESLEIRNLMASDIDVSTQDLLARSLQPELLLNLPQVSRRMVRKEVLTNTKQNFLTRSIEFHRQTFWRIYPDVFRTQSRQLRVHRRPINLLVPSRC